MFSAAALILVVAAVAPLVALAAEGASAGAFDLLLVPSTWRLLTSTVAVSAAVTVIAVVIGVPLGFVLGRTDVIGRRVLLLVHAFPLFVPPFLLGLGWFHLLGREGLVGGELTSRLLFGRIGVLCVLALAFTPIVTMMTALGLQGIDPSLEDAGRVVAKPWRVATRILLPIAWPSTALAAIVVFALAFAELGVPMFLRAPAYPAAVFARLGGIDYAPGEAFVLVIPQLAIAVVLLVLERRWIGRRPFGVLGLRRDHRPLALGPWRSSATIGCIAITLVGAAPLAALAWRAEWNGVWSWAGDSIANGLFDAAIAATIMTVCGIVIGHAFARGGRMARVLDSVAVLALVTPAAAFGAGLIAVWSRPETQFVYATSAIVIAGYVARYSILCVRPIAIAVARGSAQLEDAAATVGAGYLRRLVGIVVPVHARAIATAWLLGVVFCLRDLETAVIYYPPGRETLPVRIFTLEANGPQGVVAALAVVHVAITAGVLAVGLVAMRVWGRSR